MKTQTIDFTNAEQLMQAESQRRKVLWERKSKKLMWFMTAVLIAVFTFL